MTANREAIIAEIQQHILRRLARGPATSQELRAGYGASTVQLALGRLRATGVVVIRARSFNGRRLEFEYLLAAQERRAA